ncbi:N-acetyltransferase [Gallaecimonas kandeliae]|uniref:acyltransferase n=1 Tax=Gallaecimonas kandeliae TaxID=3029055 RepID=UPI00264A0147|nr:acyltransferase [Gallaecimonas kandeliae]WKE66786.1 N-acetyltransferase [Gallaecimonas kandeliae]
MKDIHPTALVSDKAIIGDDVSIGAFSIIHDNVVVGKGSKIESYCELGVVNKFCDDTPLVIGEKSLIRSHSVLYSSSSFGDGLVTGHRVTIRERTTVGKGFQIGTLGDIQGHCEIGDYVKCHSNVHIGNLSKIGNYVWIFPYVVLTNDPHPPSHTLLGCEIQDFAVIATMSVILPGVKVCSDTLVGAGSVVGRDVESGSVVVGNPAKHICSIDKIKLKDGTGGSAYPWRRHFHRGYPEAEVEKWISEFSESL